ncbi:MAG: hypothetical protein ACKOEQ_14860, partial [Verrucomicrobiota bacterium]
MKITIDTEARTLVAEGPEGRHEMPLYSDGAFEVSYPAPGAAYTVNSDTNGVTAEWTAGDGGTLRLFGVAAAGRSAGQVVEQVIADDFPDAVVDYELPNATVGFEPGY